MELLPEEIAYIEHDPARCRVCNHLLIFHQYEQSQCDIPQCPCVEDPYTGLKLEDGEVYDQERKEERHAK
jgi:hypothetical protein